MNTFGALLPGHWLRTRLSLVALVLAVAGMGSACSAKFTVERAADRETPAADVVSLPASEDADRDGVADSTDICPDEAETPRGWDSDTDGCPDTVDDLLALARDDVNDFWQRTFEAAGERYRAPDVFQSYSRTIRTACGESVPMNAFYCPRSNGIYFDQSLIEDSLAAHGDFAVVFIIAHEWGHLAQAELGISSADHYSIELELQADCFAGAYSKDTEDRGLLEQGDLDEAAAALFQAGDPRRTPPFAEGAHGTSKQRRDAFDTGYTDGVEGCGI